MAGARSCDKLSASPRTARSADRRVTHRTTGTHMRLRTGGMRPFMIRGAVIAISLVLLGATPATAGATSPTFMRWKLAFDLRTHPNQNPVPSNFGKPDGVEPAPEQDRSSATAITGCFRRTPPRSVPPGSRHGTATSRGSAAGCPRSASTQPTSPCRSAPLMSPAAPRSLFPPQPVCPSLRGPAPTTDPSRSPMTRSPISTRPAAMASPTSSTSARRSYRRSRSPTAAPPRCRQCSYPSRRGQSLYFIVSPGPNNNSGCDTTQLQITIDGVVS